MTLVAFKRRYKTLRGAVRSQKALEDKEDAIRRQKALLDAGDVKKCQMTLKDAQGRLKTS